jgi:hypothetical protein
MAEPRNDTDRSQARREAATLLGVDLAHMTAADGLRVDMISALRLVIDSEQASILSGGGADLQKLNVAVASLIALLPGQKLAEPAPAEGGPSDPRQIMFRTYMEMRRRGAQFGIGYDGLKLENERLKARVAELEAALAGSGAGNHAPAPVADNVVLLRSSPTSPNGEVPSPTARPPKPAPAEPMIDLRAGYSTGPAEPWRDHLNANFDPWADNRR